ncbi:MAG: hypothetical protein ACQEQJ_09810 [Halobacteriota archaeon]|uniref:Uncharacterized protein n=1 Tax=Halodesulfurarchaeum formicicum TaxID=1873524 RepID=A0A1D8S1Q4_9EURY|nr:MULTISPECIES: hypothetical protein [Halodesulfurarchaeum]AOW79296.1 hypothetical protein HTSR_0086 [Halodesulfurarchaeum formicicum]MDR5656067.1 hypothetical protein [Halodesulfurarchaeum sp. HSR-GB]
MDRIAALRTVEEALAAFEQGEIDLDTMEARVQGTLRTYATEFDDGNLGAYRATGDQAAEGLIVVAESPTAARERVLELLAPDRPDFEVEPVD